MGIDGGSVVVLVGLGGGCEIVWGGMGMFHSLRDLAYVLVLLVGLFGAMYWVCES